jgi:hypothetical protein
VVPQSRVMLTAAGISVAIFVAAVVAVGVPDWSYARTFEAIERGARREAVVALLGEPASTSRDCYVAQFVHYTSTAQWPSGTPVAYCAHWIGPGYFGRFYAIAFDSTDLVVASAYGDS